MEQYAVKAVMHLRLQTKREKKKKKKWRKIQWRKQQKMVKPKETNTEKKPDREVS